MGDGRECPQGPFEEFGASAPPSWVTAPLQLDVTPPPPPPVPAAPPPPVVDAVACRRSVEGLTAGAQKCAGFFYGCLFSVNPGLRSMFPPVMSHQNDRLFAALLKITSLLDQPDVLERYLLQLGADHRKYGVRPEHYKMVGDALFRTLRQFCSHWDEAAEASWMAAYTMASETMIAGAEMSPGPPFWRGRVIKHELRTPDLAVLTVQTDQPLPYEPGQYVTVQTPRWPRVWRQFSLASAPGPDLNLIELHVRKVPGGWVSTALTRDLGPDGEIIIGPPVGGMTADQADGRDMLLVAGGVGLAPLKALAEDVLARDESAMAGGWGHRRNITLFHGARTPMELYEMPALRRLSDSYPWLHVVPVVSDDETFHGHRGSVCTAAAEHGDWFGREAYLAGPPGMITAAERELIKAGVPAEHIHHD